MATDVSLSAICNQRIRQMLFTIPPVRLAGPNNVTPYPKYTEAQLNMRRKAEILKYSATKTNSKTNNYTKAERYALLISGRAQKNSYTSIVQPNFTTVNGVTTYDYNVIKANIVSCKPNYDMIPTPTSSSDIPGPIQYLVRDLSIPLYNYANNQDAYSFDPNINIPFWNTIVKNDVFSSTGTNTLIFSLGILESIDQPSYNFTFSTPFSIYFSESFSSTATIDSPGNQLTINSVTASVYYSGSKVTNINPTYSIANNAKSNMIFDISFNNNTSNNQTNVYVSQYSGILTVSNLNLYTSPGYVYDIYLNFNIDASLNSYATVSTSNKKYGVICNLSNSTNQIVGNVALSNVTPNVPSFSPFTFGGR
jgi:hypothetical protein